MEIRAAKARSGHFDENLIALQVRLGSLGFLDFAIFRSFKDCEGRHRDFVFQVGGDW